MLCVREKEGNGVKATLTDIAQRVGVSAATVQRALNGLEGVGPEKRALIQKVAEEMGYRRNLTASALKTGVKTIAVVLPETQQDSRYYSRYLWSGARECAAKFKEFSLDILETEYVRNPRDHAAAILGMLEKRDGELDGLLTMGIADQPVADAVAKYGELGIPVVHVGTDSGLANRLCCVRTYDEMAGRMAADLLINFTNPENHSKVVMTGDLGISDQFYNAQGFERHLWENGCPLEVMKLANYENLDVVKEGIVQVLNSGLDIRAAYATSARNTVAMCQAVAESGHGSRVRTIGQDIFPESVDLIRSGRLNAIIHKQPATQAYTAMQVLINYAVKGEEPASDTLLVDTIIVMKSNLERFL